LIIFDCTVLVLHPALRFDTLKKNWPEDRIFEAKATIYDEVFFFLLNHTLITQYYAVAPL